MIGPGIYPQVYHRTPCPVVLICKEANHSVFQKQMWIIELWTTPFFEKYFIKNLDHALFAANRNFKFGENSFHRKSYLTAYQFLVSDIIKQ